MNGNYGTGNGYNYGGWQEPEKKDSIGFGIASLVLGIISLLLFCTCINWITGLLAIVFGILQIVKGSQKGLAVGGIITAGLSMLFAVVLYISIVVSASASDMNYEDLYDYYYGSSENYYDYYDSYDDYYDDYYDGYYDEYDFGNGFLSS